MEYKNGKLEGKVKKYNKNGYLDIELEYLNGEIIKGKEFLNGQLIYEGGYSLRQRNGKGKLYNNGNLIFEGEYIYGKLQNGKGKLYGYNDNLLFDGEIINGKEWNGKKYDNNGNFSCELTNGNGTKKEYDIYGNLIREGEIINGELKKGKEYYMNEIIFDGEYSNNIRWKGKGKEYNVMGKLIFDGEYLNGIKWKGKTKLYHEDHRRIKFEGEYIDGKLSGKAKEYYDDGIIKFEGEYWNGKRWNGKIFLFLFNGDRYEEEIKDGKYLGNLEIFYNNGNKFIGEYNQFTENRKGKEFNQQGKLLFEGEYINDIPMNGYKIEYNDVGEIIFEGEYLHGKRNGKGKEYLNGKIIFEGEYLNGERKNKN